MRPMFHPPIETVRLEAILHALSDPVRVQIFSEIAGADWTAEMEAAWATLLEAATPIG